MERSKLNQLQFLIIIILAILSIQVWTGDYINLFSLFPIGPVNFSLNGLFQALQVAGFFPVYHASEGILLFAFSFLVLIFALKTKKKGIVIISIIGSSAVISATIGGMFFVFSGFLENGYSMQMGGSFIGAYASYFLVLFLTKRM